MLLYLYVVCKFRQLRSYAATPVPGDSARYIQRVIARDDFSVLS